LRVAGLAIAALLLATAAHADPCTAIPDHGPLPPRLAPGRIVEGPVRYIGDGDGLCIALGPRPDQWVEIRLADFYAPELGEPGGPEAKRALERLVMNRRLSCRIEKQSYDRAVGRCTLNGAPVGELLRRAGVKEGGRGR
jgi:micrococcal nuclease